jgi:chemotaxis family two-component system response regulator Rcp1
MPISYNAKPVDILLVEDNPGDIRLILETLSEGSVPYKITVAKDGEEAVNLVCGSNGKEGCTPEIIIMDLKLPKKGGFEVLDEIRKNKETSLTPVIVLSSSDSENDIIRSYELRANCYITKPIDLDKFVVTINSINQFWLTIVRRAR